MCAITTARPNLDYLMSCTLVLFLAPLTLLKLENLLETLALNYNVPQKLLPTTYDDGILDLLIFRKILHNKLMMLFKMYLLYDRVGLNSMNLVGQTCDLVRKLLMVSMQDQV